MLHTKFQGYQPSGSGEVLKGFKGKWLTSWLSFVMSNCAVVTFPIGILGQVWSLIVLIPDLYPLSYFLPYMSMLAILVM